MMRIAGLVAIGDWVTKAAATWAVEGELVVSEKLRFAVLHNDGAAFGVSVGAYTWQLNLALTLAAIVLMIPVSRDLARIDSAAPRALGLIMGGALGNLASLVTSPPGVVDFISVSMGTQSELVLNVADFAAYIGLAMIMRTGLLITRELRKASRPIGARLSYTTPMWTKTFTEREVPVPVLLAADAPVPHPEIDPTPRPESVVRRSELADEADPKVIDIRPHLQHRTERLVERPSPDVEPRL
jgi:lipoprotein signal peptidase